MVMFVMMVPLCGGRLPADRSCGARESLVSHSLNMCVKTVESVCERRMTELRTMETAAMQALEDSMRSLILAVECAKGGGDLPGTHVKTRKRQGVALHDSSPDDADEYAEAVLPDDASEHSRGQAICRPVGAAPPFSSPAAALSSLKRGMKLPQHITDVLMRWFLSHQDHPYPNTTERAELCRVSTVGRMWYPAP